jgi:hypothetical protein
MNGGDTFRIIGKADNHLWVVISDPDGFPESVVFVNLTTFDRHKDQTVILGPEDHSFIDHKTVVAYDRARMATDAQLETLKQHGHLKLHDPIEGELLSRLRQGASQSPNIEQRFVDMLEQQNLLDW